MGDNIGKINSVNNTIARAAIIYFNVLSTFLR